MPPKIKVTKEDIVAAALDIVRRSGAEAINARTVAAALQCSTQPVFSNFATMEDLRLAVVQKADAVYQSYVTQETASGNYPAYKASGMAYIRFAKEEKELFKLLFMRDRSSEVIPEETELTNRMENMISSAIGLEGDNAKLFHLEMWAYVHGLATMIATDYFTLDTEFISELITDCYQGLIKQHERKKQNGSN